MSKIGLAVGFLTLAVSLSPQTGIGAEPAQDSLALVTQDQVLAELRARKFDELDQQASARQKLFESDVRKEDRATNFFNFFAVSDPAIGDLLAEWVKAAPNSFAAHAALARYLDAAGWNARGWGYANTVPAESLKKMDELLAQADREAQAALKLNPKVMSPYNVLISDAQAGCDFPSMVFAYDAAIRQDPACHGPRYQFIQALQPQWCGSQEEVIQFAMEKAAAKFAEDFRKFMARNPNLHPQEAMSKFAGEMNKSAAQNPQLKPEAEMAKQNEEEMKLAAQNPLVKRFNAMAGGGGGYEAMEKAGAKFAEDFRKFMGRNPNLNPREAMSKFAEEMDKSAAQNPQLKPEAAMAKLAEESLKSSSRNPEPPPETMAKWKEEEQKIAAQDPLVIRFNEITGGKDGYDAMEQVAEDARKFAAQNPRLNFLIGDVYVARAGNALFEQKYDDAIKFYSQAIEKTGGDWSYYEDRAEAFSSLKRYGDALSDLNRAEALAPNTPKVIKERAYVLAAMVGGSGQAAYEDAIKAFSKSIAEGYKNWAEYQGRAEMYYMLKQNDKALSDLNRANELSPNNGTTIYYRALVLGQLGRTKDALADIAHYRQLGMRNPDIDQLEKSLQYANQTEKGQVPSWQPDQGSGE